MNPALQKQSAPTTRRLTVGLTTGRVAVIHPMILRSPLRHSSALALAGGLALGCQSTPRSNLRGFEVTRLDGARIRLLPEASTRAWVFVFLSVDCPIANRCLPELNALARTSPPHGIRFIFVYPNADELPAAIRQHQEEFGVVGEVYRDPHHDLARQLDASVTPEVILLEVDGSPIYRGRVNDQYLTLGRGRPEPTQHDLADAIQQFRAGHPSVGVVHPAVGCTFRTR